MFQDAHLPLAEGKGELPGVFCNELQAAYFGPLQGDRNIREFISQAQRTFDAISADRRGASALPDQLVTSTTPLLAVLNRLTAIYEEESKRHALKLKKQQQDMMNDIKTILRQAWMIRSAHKSSSPGLDMPDANFAVVAAELSNITSQIDDLTEQAMQNSNLRRAAG
jgi:hypothetical protein